MKKTYEEWAAANPPPDLQQLAEKYGGLMRVPPDEWTRWDRELRTWQLRYQTRHFD